MISLPVYGGMRLLSLSGLGGSHLLDTIHERIKTSVESFREIAAMRSAFFAQSERFQDGINTVGAHELCTVQQSQSFFTFQFYRLPAKFIEYTDGFRIAYLYNIHLPPISGRKGWTSEQDRRMHLTSHGHIQWALHHC